MLTATNTCGKTSGTVHVNVLDVSGKPSNIIISEVNAISCVLGWDAPVDNGGSSITHYMCVII